VLRAVDQQQAPSRHMQQADQPIEAAEARAFASIEGPPNQSPGGGHDRKPNRYRDFVATLYSR